ncbi:ricin-type beta-trefoil lectin domain protein [Streptomyces sp. NPDC059909]|uniref:ricin-type beta-trefoil lectin domain protein n=1 Tax=Streptomyces sp. NPDC059909 TaxID=3346998 RepID=UPI00365F90F2
MPELHQVGPDPADAKSDCTALSDGEITERIRAGAPRALPATQELKRRHLPAVMTYARLCGRNQVAGNQLALQAFDLAAQETCRGIEPRGNWRHHLLMLVQRVGLTWAAGSRRDRLAPDFAAWVDDIADVPAPGLPGPRRLRLEAASPMLTGFYRLPQLTRGVLWYAVVDEEPDAAVAAFLGMRTSLVPELRIKAQDAMRQAYIQAYLERGEDKKCLGFRRIIEAAARPGDRRHSEDLRLHLAECQRCTRLVAELARMADGPRTVFAEGLLGWGGAAYAAHDPVHVRFGAGSSRPDRLEQPDRPVRHDRPNRPDPHSPLDRSDWSHWSDVPDGPKPMAGVPGTTASAMSRIPRRMSLPVVLVAVAVVGAVVAGTVLATASEDARPAADRTEEPPVQAAWPTVSVPLPTPSAGPSRKPSKQPSRSPSPAASASASRRPAPAPSKPAPPRPRPIVPGGGYVQVVNAASGLCLDIEDGVMENRTDVITARCSAAPTQLWSLDSLGLLRSGADPDYCLDSRGATDRGAGIWSCASVEGRNGMNLRFTVDGSGAIRPRIAPDFALEPLGDDEGASLSFSWADGDGDQRWTAGTVPED